MRDQLEESFVHAYSDKTYVHTEIVTHQGTVVAFALDSDRRLSYTVLDLTAEDDQNLAMSQGAGDASDREVDARYWLKSACPVPFPYEIEQVGYGLLNPVRFPVVSSGATVEAADPDSVPANQRDSFLSTSARLTKASAPFQVLSDNQYIYLFRQAIDRADTGAVYKLANGGCSAGPDTATPSKFLKSGGSRVPIVDNTLLVDRFVLSGNTLALPREIRFRRSRNRTRPASAKDSMGAADMQGEPFFEPTKELAFVANMANGCFSTVLVPTEVPDIERWQIFSFNSATSAIDGFSVERASDGLFNTQGSQLWTSPDDAYRSSVLERQAGTCPFTGRALVPVEPPRTERPMAMGFDGTSDSIVLTDSADLRITGDQTIELWAKLPAFTGRQNPINKSYGAEGAITIETDGLVNYYFGPNTSDGSPHYQLTTTTPLTAGTWHHLAVVRDLTNRRVTWYINGQASGTASTALTTDGTGRWLENNSDSTGTTASGASNAPVTIGNGYAGYFSGELDEVRIWNTARTGSEVLESHSMRLHGDEPGLVSYLRFDRTVDGSPIDLANRSRAITVTGAPQQGASDAPPRRAPAIEKSSFAFEGRRAGAGMTAKLYYEQEQISTGKGARSVKQNARVLLTAVTDGPAVTPPVGNGRVVHFDGAAYQGGNQWDDLSGSGHHAFAKYGSPMPSMVKITNNGKEFPVLRGDSNGATAPIEISRLAVDGPFTMMIVDSHWHHGGGNSINAAGGWVRTELHNPRRDVTHVAPNMHFGRVGATSAFLFQRAGDVDGPGMALDPGDDGNVATPVPSTVGQFNMSTGIVTANEVRWYLDGAHRGTWTPPSAFEPKYADFTITGPQASVDVACVLIWDRVISDGERQQVEAWLGERYGIAINHSVQRSALDRKLLVAADFGVGRDGRLAASPATIPTPAMLLPDAGGDGTEAITGEIDALERTLPTQRTDLANLDAQLTHLETHGTRAQRIETRQSIRSKQAKLLADERRLAVLHSRQVGAVPPATMATNHTDPQGLTIASGLMPFAQTEKAPQVFDSAVGRLTTYFTGTDGAPKASYYNIITSKGRWELPTASGSMTAGSVNFQARSAGDLANGVTVTVSDGSTAETCTVVIANERAGLTETWQDIPREAREFVSVLRGEAGQPTFLSTTKDATTAGAATAIGLASGLSRSVPSGAVLQIDGVTSAGRQLAKLTATNSAASNATSVSVSGTLSAFAAGAAVSLVPYDYATKASTNRSGDRLDTGSLQLVAALGAGTGGLVVNTSGGVTTSSAVVGGQWVSDAPGQALSFDGTSQHLQASNPAGLAHQDNLSIEAWVEPRGFTGDRIVANCNSGESNYTLGVTARNPGTGAAFDGLSSVEIPNHPDLQIDGDLTIEMWIKIGVLSGRRNPFYKSYGAEGALTIEEDGQLRYYFGPNTEDVEPYFTLKSITRLTVHTWHHIALVRDMNAGRATLYINGRQEVSESFHELVSPNADWAGTLASSPVVAAGKSTGPMVIGDGYVDGFTGDIDEVRIWNIARTRLEINADRTRRIEGLATGLVAYYYDLGRSKEDRTGNGHDGALVGPALGTRQSPLDGYRVFAAVGESTIVTTPTFVANSWHHLSAVYRQDYSLVFNGNDMLDAGTDLALDLTDDLTIEAVVKLDGGGRRHGIVSKGSMDDGGAGTCPYAFYVNDGGQLVFAFEDEDGTNRSFRSTGTVPVGQVKRIAVTRRQGRENKEHTKNQAFTFTDDNGVERTRQTQVVDSIEFKDYSEITFYIDGQLSGTSRHEGKKPGGNRGQLFIGRAYLESKQRAQLSGTLAELRIWSQARSAGDIGALQLTGTEAGLTAWWRFNDGSGPIANDSRGGNHARVIGATWAKSPDTNRQGFTILVDGAPVDSMVTATRPAKGDPNTFTIGGRLVSSAAEQLYVGRLEEVRIWKTARRREAILDNMFTRLQGDSADLLANYTFDGIDAATGQVPDLGLGSNHLSPASQTGRPTQTRSTAPVSNEAPQIRSASAGAVTDFIDHADSAPAAAEYADLQRLDDGSMLGVYKRCYTYTSNGTWRLVTGYKVGNLVTEWLGQAQFDPQVVGYIEGAPPVPSENLTEGYRRTVETFNGTSEVSLTESESVNYSFSSSSEGGFKSGFDIETSMGAKFEPRVITAPMGIGLSIKLPAFKGTATNTLELEANSSWSGGESVGAGRNLTRRMAASIGGNWEGGDNPSSWVNPELSRRFVPGNMGFAFVESETTDIYALRLAHTGTLVAFRMVPNPDIPRDTNIIPFPMNNRYTKQGTLDGRVGYSSEGGAVLDPDYSNAAGYGEYSYFKPREAYRLKRRIEREEQRLREYFANYDTTPPGARAMGPAATAGAGVAAMGFATAAKFGGSVAAGPVIAGMTIAGGMGATVASLIDVAAAGDDDLPSKFARRNLVNTYVWTADGGFYEESTQLSEVRSESKTGSYTISGETTGKFGVEIDAVVSKSFSLNGALGGSYNLTKSKSEESSTSFSIDMSLLVGDNLQRYEYINPTDATKGHRPVYDGSGNPVNQHGKVDAYRFMTFYLEPEISNFEDLFGKVIDPIWLAQSDHPNAVALRNANQSTKKPRCWRLFHRVTFVSRILPSMPGATAPPLEKKMKQLNIDSNYQLVRRLEPYVDRNTTDWIMYKDAVERAVRAHMPELATESELRQIVDFMADYHGVAR